MITLSQSILPFAPFSPLTVAILLITSLSALSVQQPSSDQVALFDVGNKQFEQGRFVDAIATYEKVEKSGVSSAALYFNLGNAYLKANQFGRAISEYKMAKQLAPRDADIRANLEFARRQVQGPTVYRMLWERWLDWCTINEWTVAAMCCFWILVVGLSLRYILPSRWRFRIVVPVLACVTIALAGCAGILYKQRNDKILIVVADVAIAHQGPLDESPAAFTAHDGAELHLLDTKGDWFQVTTDSKRIGWVRKTDAVLPEHS